MDSNQGGGSVFTFIVPLQAAPSPADTIPSQTSSLTAVPDRSLRILLADDGKQNQFLLQSYFARTGHSLTAVDDGQEAVTTFKSDPFDVVLLDLHMPVLDGYGAARQIRDWERDNGRREVPILILSADAMEDRRQQALASGCTAYLSKPIKKAVLMAALALHTARAAE